MHWKFFLASTIETMDLTPPGDLRKGDYDAVQLSHIEPKRSIATITTTMMLN